MKTSIITGVIGLCVWILKTVANAKDPDRKKANARLKLAKDYNDVLAKKVRLDEKIKKCKNFIKKKNLEGKLMGLLSDLRRLRGDIYSSTKWS